MKGVVSFGLSAASGFGVFLFTFHVLGSSQDAATVAGVVSAVIYDSVSSLRSAIGRALDDD